MRETSPEDQLAQTQRELFEARELQAASAQVLRIISTSPKDVQPAFDAIAESAVRLCKGQFSFVLRFDNDVLRFGASHGLTLEGLEAFRRELPRPADEGTASGRAILQRAIIQIPDVLTDPAYGVLRFAETVTYRSLLSVPMLRDGHPIGAITVGRPQAGMFSDALITLLQTFADQAVIAIENVRLFDDVQKRTAELSEALEQQTATSEVLQVISASPGELEPVFEAILANGTRLCEAKFGSLFLKKEDGLYFAAGHNMPPAYVEARQRGPFHGAPGGHITEAIRTKQTVQIADLAATQLYVERSPRTVEAVELGGIRTAVAVPMLKDNELTGIIVIYRQEVRPFTNKQVALLTSFASQAVIAIENTRLLNELRKSLQQQTATSNVLEVISRSAFDLQPVFETVCESAVRLCEAERAFIFRFDGELLRMVAAYNVSDEMKAFVESNPIRPGRHSGSARAALERRTIHIHDIQADSEYSYGTKNIDDPHTLLGVPILKGDDLLGVILIYRLEVKPFADKQIELVETFADQAAIAIENVRLFDDVKARTEELSESLQQQTATADVLKVISRSTFDLQAVLDTLVEIGRPDLPGGHGTYRAS